MELFLRKWRAQIGEFSTDQLRIQFKVSKTLEKEPNTCELRITNLAAESRGKLKGAGLAVIVEAGYAGGLGVIFSGDSRTVDHANEKGDWLTLAQCGDGEQAYLYARCNESFAPGARVADVIRNVADKMSLNKGNLEDALALPLLVESFSHGYTAFGKASEVFSKLMTTAGLAWSIQQGQILITADPRRSVWRKGTAFYEQAKNLGSPGTAYSLSAATGLVGSPVHAPPDKKKKGSFIKVKSLLNPQLAPGRVVTLDSRFVKGEFVIQKLDHEGDSHGRDWFTTFEAVARKT